MIILKGYKKEAALMVRLKKLSRVFGFTIESGLETIKEVKKEEPKERGPKPKVKDKE